MAESGKAAGKAGALRREFVLATVLVLLLVAALLAFFYSQFSSSRRESWLALDHQLGALSGRFALSLEYTAVTPDVAALSAARKSLQEGVTTLRDGDALGKTPPAADAFPVQLAEIDASWKDFDEKIGAYLDLGSSYADASEALGRVRAALPATAAQYQQLTERQATRGAPTGQVVFISGQLMRLQQIQLLSQQVLPPGRSSAEAIQRLAEEADTFLRNHQSLQATVAGDELSVAMLARAAETFTPVSEGAAALRAAAPALAGLYERGQLAAVSAKALEARLGALREVIEGSGRNPLLSVVLYGTGGLSFILLLAFLMSTVRATRERERMAEERDARQQAAILSLLDEITNLADGDLTVDVIVTEDFTGAIADSINYTVDTLRRLVGTINDTSVEIASAASSTQDTAQRMSQASERQAREIASVANLITQTSQSLTQVSGRAEELAQEAANSVQVAHNGAATVGRTIQGMAALREQIQETAKRIKRLGESSQEIGNIIEFINDISEQTNTLALNASIQAAMAGESGRGFAVVAKEVQRLSERAASATRQIETLVKTIQADTNEAIVSMERSTTTVVLGAKSAEEAGQALTRIESSSTELARLIQDISVSARAQSAQATRITGQMQVIRDIAVQTSGSAGKTAGAVGELTTLSEKLRESVSGFKLPNDAAVASDLNYSSAT